MTKKITHQLLEDRKILVRHIHVLGSIDAIINTWKTDIEEGIVNKDLVGVISYVENPAPDIDIEDYKKLERYYIDNFDIFGCFKMAQVIQTPAIAFAKIFEEYNPQFKTQSFSTIEGALEWIEII